MIDFSPDTRVPAVAFAIRVRIALGRLESLTFDQKEAAEMAAAIIVHALAPSAPIDPQGDANLPQLFDLSVYKILSPFCVDLDEDKLPPGCQAYIDAHMYALARLISTLLMARRHDEEVVKVIKSIGVIPRSVEFVRRGIDDFRLKKDKTLPLNYHLRSDWFETGCMLSTLIHQCSDNPRLIDEIIYANFVLVVEAWSMGVSGQVAPCEYCYSCRTRQTASY